MDQLAQAAERVAATSSRREKITHLANYFQSLDNADFARAVLYLSGAPFPSTDPRKLSVGYATMRAALQALGEDYIARDAGIEVREMSGGWIVMTRPEQAEWIGRMLRGKRKTRLSRAALETMAIIAYKQPVTKSEVEAIRGVDASGVLATLLERNLVTIKGRSTVVGRPLLYGTTNEFLNYFGLRDLTELPRPEELRALVAAREPEQMEMLELDPDTGMPLLAEAGAAAVAVLAADSLEGEAAATTADEGEERHARAASADDEESFDEDDDEEFEDDEDSDDSDEEEFEDDDDSDEDLDADEDEDEDDDDDFSLADADAALGHGRVSLLCKRLFVLF